MRSRSRSRDNAPEEPDPQKVELITSVLKLQAFYNKVPEITKLFNPFDVYLGPTPNDNTSNSISFNVTASNASKQVRSVNHHPSFDGPFGENNDKEIFRPADDFKYELNPYNRQLLDQKKEQVLLEMAFLDSNIVKLATSHEEVETFTKASPTDLNVVENSNVKWFESATDSCQEVARMLQVIDK